MSSLKRKRITASLQSTPSKAQRTTKSSSAHRSLNSKAPKHVENHVADTDPLEEEDDEITLATPTKPRSTNAAPRTRTPLTKRVNGLQHGAADRSAKRKSTQKIVQQGEASDDEDDELGEGHLARRILEEDEDERGSSDPESLQEVEASSQHDDSNETQTQMQETPTKRPRGRPKSSVSAKAKAKEKRTPTPPRQLPPHEHYFFQNRPGASKTSSNTLSSTALLTHEQYRDALKDFKDPHQPEIDFLHDMHAQSFSQWLWELECGFSVGLYGWGSKREIVREFGEFVADESGDEVSVMVVNGYADGVGFKDVLNTLASTIPRLCNKTGALEKLPANPSDAVTVILDALSSSNFTKDTSQDSPPKPTHIFLINSLDAPPLRRSPTPVLLSQLSRHPRVALLATFNQPNFPLLWDAPTRATYNWAFHDATTFAPFDAEIPDVVGSVNSLLGRSGRRVQGREGVVYVLRSLTGSARRLFALVCAECIAAAEGDGAYGGGVQGGERGFGADDRVGGGYETDDDDMHFDENDDDDDDDDDNDEQPQPGRRQRQKSKRKQGRAPGLGMVEYRALYRKAVQSLIATSEVQFRQLLKEFFDHEMLVSERGADGAEMLGLAFRREECEEILEELVVDE